MKGIKKRLAVFLMLAMALSCLPALPAERVYAADGYIWPSQTTKTSRGYTQDHQAVDIAAPYGSNVYATKAGTVYFVYTGCNNNSGYASSGHSCTSSTCSPSTKNFWSPDVKYFCNYGYGNGVVIKHADGSGYSMYAHMSTVSVTRGASVAAGAIIGKSGSTGASTGAHLHFELSAGGSMSGSYFEPSNNINNNWGTITYTMPGHTHSYTPTVTQQATCTEAGNRRYSCSCGNSYDETIPALGHDYQVTKVVAATTTSQGYTLYICSRCGAEKKDNYTDIEKEDGWTYVTALPSDVNSSEYTIQYNNTYTKTGTTSPGSDWTVTATSSSSHWENVGSQYEEYTTVNTSDTKQLVDYYYFHFCSGSTGAYVNYCQTDTYVHWDAITGSAAKNVSILSTGTDSDSANIPTYQLSQYCSSGTTCDGTYGSHGKRSNYWYRMNVYQNRKKVTVNTYTYSKSSGWVSYRDPSAASVAIRYKKNTSSVQPSSSDSVQTTVKQAAVKKVTAGIRCITVYASSKASVLGGSGYQIAYRVSGTSKWKYASTTAAKKKILFLSKGKKYQVKIRAYKKSGSQTTYGEWSSIAVSGTVK